MEGFGDSGLERIGDSVLASVCHHLAELLFKPGRVRTRRAQVEVVGDLVAAVVGQFPVEIVVELFDG
jgi:hypothetical protein